MDKNLVNIDNLFRQKLGGAEEKERDGAWASMRDLLDKEMPKDKATGFGFNRMALYSGLVLLFATIGIGAWEMRSGINLPGSGMLSSGESHSKNAANTGGEISGDASRNTDVNNQPSANSAVSATKAVSGFANAAIAANTKVQSTGNKSTTGEHKATAKSTPGNLKTNDPSVSPETSDVATKTSNVISSAMPVATKAPGKIIAKNKLTKTATTFDAVVVNKTSTPTSVTGNAVKVKSESTNTAKHNLDNGSRKSANVLAAAVTGKKLSSNNKPTAHRTEEAVVASATQSNKNNETAPVKIKKLVLNQRLVRDEKSGWYFTYDTVSQEMLFEQLNSINKLVEQDQSVNQSGNDHALATNGAVANLPAGSLKTDASAESPSLKSSKENSVSVIESKNEKSAGAKLIDNLSSAFNDIKISSSNMQFTKGLTGGMNGTFFGPASFYGFNFGVSGSFNFGDAFTIKTELKYFQRINTDYSLNDDYYAYEPNTGGGYRKSKIDYDFAFSSLHSIELPVSFKFNVANFSCFAGANFLYTFGINTSPAPLPDPNAPVQVVQTKGNDDQPTLNYKDFSQRFGIGYLFGIAFRLDPRSELDLRTVQTVWDNVRTDGAKAVSSTLYKNPSLQLSFNYRIGGNGKRDRNK